MELLSLSHYGRNEIEIYGMTARFVKHFLFFPSLRLELVMRSKEPMFSRQEQALVYLFSRHWEQLPAFQKKRISKVQMRFPDASMVDCATGHVEAIEFEYALSSFHRLKPADRKTLKDYDALYIVYWEHDTDAAAIRTHIKKHFGGRVQFVCLNNYFGPCVEAAPDCLHPCWEFPRPQEVREAYSLKDIEQETLRLCQEGIFTPLTPRRTLYRTLGFNKTNSRFIQCDHWKTIHLFATWKFGGGSIPSKLFVKPKGYQRFVGYFDIRLAFGIEKDGKAVEEYFKNYYFYPCNKARTETCLVYSDFRELIYDQGSDLYKYLKDEGYALGRASELIEDRKHHKGIKEILG
jgi:hypothetical protein